MPSAAGTSLLPLEVHVDAGHGWVRATRQLLSELRIHPVEISTYSYVEGNFVYLEEDCDAAILWRAFKREYAHDPVYKTVTHDGLSFIRLLSRHDPTLRVW